MFQDIGVGIFISILVSYVFGVPLTLALIFFSIFFALLPDIDLLLPKKLVRGHRGITHYPFLYVVVSIGVFFLFGSLWSFVFFIATLYHLLHDTLFLGWGIKWLWPFSLRSFKLFPDRDGKITNEVMLSWLPEEEEGIKSRYASPHWIRDFYFRANIISISEYTVFISSLICLYLYLR